MENKFIKITRETASSDQLSLVGEIIAYKEHSLVPSATAYKFLKAEARLNEYLSLADSKHPHNLTLEQFKSFCAEINVSAQFSMEVAAITNSDIYNGGAFTFHHVLRAQDFLEDLAGLEFKPDYKAGRYIWHLDYAEFFHEFFKHPEYEHYDERGQLNADTVASIFEDTKIFTLVETGETISLTDFKNNPAFRSVSDPDELEAKFVMLMQKGEENFIEHLQAIHDRWAQRSLNYVYAHAERAMNTAYAEVTQPEVEYFYLYKEIYQRAAKENNLHKKETQLAVARAFIMNRRFYESSLFTEDPFPYERLMSYAKRIVKGPGSLVELTKSEYQEAIERKAMGSYILSALTEHKDLLEHFFRSLPYKKENDDLT